MTDPSRRPSRLRWLAAALLLAAVPAVAQEGTGGDLDRGGDTQPPPYEVKRRGDRETRKEKRERKRLKAEQKRANEERKRLEEQAKRKNKDEKKWRKMGLQAQTADDWYAEALRRYKSGKYLQAREILLPLEDSPRALDVQDKVKLLIADTYYYQGGTLNLAEALARYRSYLTFYPNGEHSEYAQFQLGNSYFKQLGPPDRDQSFTDNAIAEYEKLLRLYPGGEYADAAEDRLLEAKARRARHEFEVAKFYWQWDNHDAVADRVVELLHERPESPDREEALYVAAQSLYNIGEDEEAAAYAARLQEDYPASGYASRVNPTAVEKAKAKRLKRERRREKETARTHRRQLRRERRRTRQIRKDSGLPAAVPADAAMAIARAEQAESESARKDAKEAEKAVAAQQRHEEKMRRLEEQEQAQRAAELEREAAKRAKRAEQEAAAEAKKRRKEQQREEKRARKEGREGDEGSGEPTDGEDQDERSEGEGDR